MKSEKSMTFTRHRRSREFGRGFTPPPFLVFSNRENNSANLGVSDENTNFTRKVGGFTLVELIVSMALFIVVVFITTSAFLTLATLSKKASATRIAMDNLSIAIEMMARNMRTGYTYHCDGDLSTSYSATDLKGNGFMNNDGTPSATFVAKDCPGGLPYIAFVSEDGDLMFFRLDDDNSIRMARGFGDQTNNITGSDIFIDTFKVYVIGADNTSGATKQPRVNIVVRGTAGTDPKTQSKFDIYTSVTQRAPKE